jgi:hypothetical protein
MNDDMPVSDLQQRLYKRYTGLRMIFVDGEQRYIATFRVGLQQFDLSSPAERDDAEHTREMCAKALVNVLVLREYEVP